MASQPGSTNQPTDSAAVPVVRQPIVNRQKELFAYDLRFASDPDVISLDGDPEQAWSWIRHRAKIK